jgi:hypothetical protein
MSIRRNDMTTSSKSPSERVFKSRGGEARFWEKNFDQAWKSGKPVNARVSKNLSEMINIRLDPKTIDYVRQEADRKGIGPTQLIRMWIKERINESRPSSVGA